VIGRKRLALDRQRLAMALLGLGDLAAVATADVGAFGSIDGAGGAVSAGGRD
jgi:hypothetical protein